MTGDTHTGQDRNRNAGHPRNPLLDSADGRGEPGSSRALVHEVTSVTVDGYNLIKAYKLEEHTHGCVLTPFYSRH